MHRAGIWVKVRRFVVIPGVFCIYMTVVPLHYSEQCQDSSPCTLTTQECLAVKTCVPKAMALLSRLEKRVCLKKFFCTSCPHMQNPNAQNDVGVMYRAKNLQTLHTLWHELESHNFSSSPLLITDFLSTLISIFSYSANTLQSKIHATKKSELEEPGDSAATQSTFTLQNIAHLYFSLQTLPVIQLISLLETLVIQTQDLLQTYELQGTLNIRQWFAKYWWVPPVFVLSVVHIVISNYATFQSYNPFLDRTGSPKLIS